MMPNGSSVIENNRGRQEINETISKPKVTLALFFKSMMLLTM